MPNLNHVALMGSLTRDPEVRYLPNGTAVAEIGLATNRTWKNDRGEKQEECTFVDVTLFGRTAELAGEYLKKGSPVYIDGRLKLDTFETRDGQKRTKLKVIGENMQFLGSRGDSGGGERQERQERPQRSSAGHSVKKPDRPMTDKELEDMSEVPF